MYEGEIWKELQKFRHYLLKRSNTFVHYNVDKVLEVYSWFVLPDYRNKGLFLPLRTGFSLIQLTIIQLEI